MKAYVTYPTYREVNGKLNVHLYGKLENGDSFLSKSEYRPFFWIKTSDLSKARGLASFEYDSSDFLNFQDEPMTKVLVNHPRDVPSFRKLFEDRDIPCFEADVRFSYRFMMEHGIKGSCDIEGDFEKGEFVDRIYTNPVIKESYWFPKLNILSLDIETTADNSEVLSVSFYSDSFKKVFIKHDKSFRDAVSFKTEKELLEAFARKVVELDPDVIVGWNFIDFDLKVLKERFSHFRIPFVLGRSKLPASLKLTSDFFSQSTADFPGRQVLDGISLLKINFVTLEDYKLETAAQAFLKKGKLIKSVEKRFDEVEQTYHDDPQKLVDYNLLDSQLVFELLEVSGVMNLTIERSLLTGMPLDRVRASIASFDSLYLRELKKLKRVAPSSNRNAERGARTTGGYVMQGKAGIYDYILVLDFKSLYPSIIRTFNIDPLAYKGLNQEGDFVVTENGASFSRELGILPNMIQEMWRARDEAKKRKDDKASFAIKITMNSMYGVMANPTFRFYSTDMANGITHTGHHLIKKTSEVIEKNGFDVIYGDTDSVFVNSKASSYDDAVEIGNKLQGEINEFFAQYIEEKYGMKNYLDLEFEKVFSRFFMPRVRGSDLGAKKRYAGLRTDGTSEKVEFTGMEFVRSDWTELAKKFQLELFDRIFHKKEVAPFIKEYVDDLKAGKKDDLLIYSKSIRKNLDEYTKTTPPHVRAARMLDKVEFTKIKYVWTTHGPEPIQKLSHSPDYNHYVDKQIKPLADAVLGFYDLTFEEVLQNSKQKTLFGY